ncbi:Cue4p [Saccharomyces paradoxus]|uniref:Cue4p n=1 Tax=Saccharomyces paradoxus TaxID=27291 RepID=A0A8B8UWS7_SACPA|nr:Cue4 [Saccharomyces paradoxus]QHS75188.1 Cue4 [Saccharomyces paradoxus]
MDRSTIVFLLTMVCLFVYTVKRKSAKQVPLRTVQDAKPAPTAATNNPSPEPVPSTSEKRVAQLNRHSVHRKRAVNDDMVEIVMMMAPHVPQEKVVQDLRNTGSIERTMENIFAGKLD